MSVYRAFEQVQDGRHKRGVRYPVALILTLWVLGKLVGMRTPTAIAHWMRLREQWLREHLPGMPVHLPCASTYSNVLRSLDAEQESAGPVAVSRAHRRKPALWGGTQPLAPADAGTGAP
jgi:hypothetical protein